MHRSSLPSLRRVDFPVCAGESVCQHDNTPPQRPCQHHLWLKSQIQFNHQHQQSRSLRRASSRPAAKWSHGTGWLTSLSSPRELSNTPTGLRPKTQMFKTIINTSRLLGCIIAESAVGWFLRIHWALLLLGWKKACYWILFMQSRWTAKETGISASILWFRYHFLLIFYLYQT